MHAPVQRCAGQSEATLASWVAGVAVTNVSAGAPPAGPQGSGLSLTDLPGACTASEHAGVIFVRINCTEIILCVCVCVFFLLDNFNDLECP